MPGKPGEDGKPVIEVSKDKFDQMIQDGEVMPNEMQMTEEEVNEYIKGLITAQTPPVDGLEADVLGKFKRTQVELVKAQQMAAQLADSLDKTRDRVKNLAGRLDGYAELLVQAESVRRGAEISKKVTDIQDKKAADGKT